MGVTESVIDPDFKMLIEADAWVATMYSLLKGHLAG